jgi:hypothetical protein
LWLLYILAGVFDAWSCLIHVAENDDSNNSVQIGSYKSTITTESFPLSTDIRRLMGKGSSSMSTGDYEMLPKETIIR